MTFLRWKKEKEKFSLKTFLSLKNFPNKKDNNLNLLSDFIVFVAYTKRKNFKRWYSSVHPVYVMEIFSTFQLLTFNFAFFFRYKVHLQIIINMLAGSHCLQGSPVLHPRTEESLFVTVYFSSIFRVITHDEEAYQNLVSYDADEKAHSNGWVRFTNSVLLLFIYSLQSIFCEPILLSSS